MEQSNYDHYFTRRADELALPKIRVHDLHHTCATMLLTKVVHPKVIPWLPGHSQISLTLDTYFRVLPTMQEDAADTLERLLTGS
jgi:integrase